jgi:hypothetical protein
VVTDEPGIAAAAAAAGGRVVLVVPEGGAGGRARAGRIAVLIGDHSVADVRAAAAEMAEELYVR